MASCCSLWAAQRLCGARKHSSFLCLRACLRNSYSMLSPTHKKQQPGGGNSVSLWSLWCFAAGAGGLRSPCTFLMLSFLLLLLCLGYVAPMGVSLACTMWCFYGLQCATACACLYDTSDALCLTCNELSLYFYVYRPIYVVCRYLLAVTNSLSHPTHTKTKVKPFLVTA
jgi:hypothetical protein